MQTRERVSFQGIASDPEAARWGIPEGALARFGQGRINALALSPNGEYLAVGTAIGLWWYETTTLLPIALWHTNCEQLTALTFLPSGEWIATGHQDGSVRVWDVQQGDCITHVERQAHPNHKSINHIAFSPDRNYVAATSGQDYVVDVWQAADGMHLARFGDPEYKFWPCHLRRPVAFSKDSRYLASASPACNAKRSSNGIFFDIERDFITVWDVCDGQRIAHLTDSTTFLYALVFSSCGDFLVASSDNENAPTLTVWDTENWQVQKEKRNYGGYQLLPAHSVTGALRVAAISDADITVWDAAHHEKLHTYHIPSGTPQRKCVFNGTHFALETTTELIVWTVGNPTPRTTYNSHPDWPISLVFSADGKTLIAGNEFPEGTYRCWDVVGYSHTPDVFRIPGEKHRLYTASSGPLHATSVDGNTINVWEFGNDIPIAKYIIEEPPCYNAVAFSYKAQCLAYGDSKKNLSVWNVEREENLYKLTGHETNVISIDFSPDGKHLASQAEIGPDTRLWNLENGKEIQSFRCHRIEQFAFSPCGGVIAAEAEKEILLWDIKRCEPRLTIPKKIWWEGGLVFSPCGQYLATGLDRREGVASVPIKLWNTTTGVCIATLQGHPTYIFGLAFSPDGMLLASGSYDGTLLIWDMKPYF